MRSKPFFAPIIILAVFLAFALQNEVYADDYIHGYFIYTIEDDSVTITDYTGSESIVTIPAMIGGNPVNTIATGAFADSESVTTVSLPETITSIQAGAFKDGQTVSYYSTSSSGAGTAQEAEGTGETDNRTDDSGGSGSNAGTDVADNYDAADGQYEEAEVSLFDDGGNETADSDIQKSGESGNGNEQSENGNARPGDGNKQADGENAYSVDGTNGGGGRTTAIIIIICVCAVAVVIGVVVARKKKQIVE